MGEFAKEHDTPARRVNPHRNSGDIIRNSGVRLVSQPQLYDKPGSSPAWLASSFPRSCITSCSGGFAEWTPSSLMRIDPNRSATWKQDLRRSPGTTHWTRSFAQESKTRNAPISYYVPGIPTPAVPEGLVQAQTPDGPVTILDNASASGRAASITN